MSVEMPSLTTHHVLKLLKINIVGGIAILIWDWIICMGSEIEFIWSQPNTSTVKWLYFFTRYNGLVTIITGLCVMLRFPIPQDKCRIFFLLQSYTLQSQLSGVEMVLMIRVYALCNRSKKIGALLGILFMFEIGAMIEGCWRIAWASSLDFDPVCCAHVEVGRILPWIVAISSSQSVVLFLTVRKQFSIFRAGWGRTRLVQLMMRDEVYMYVAVFATLLSSGSYLNFDSALAFVLCCWALPLLSIVSSRLTLNMQSLHLDAQPETQLTTQISSIFP